MHLYGLQGFEDLERYSKYSQLSSSTNGAGKGYFLTLAMVYVDLTLGDVERLRGWEAKRSWWVASPVAVCCSLPCCAARLERFPGHGFHALFRLASWHQSASIGINRHQSASKIRHTTAMYTVHWYITRTYHSTYHINLILYPFPFLPNFYP